MSATPTITTCDLCEMRMAALPGPMRKFGRPSPPPGYRIGYIVEQANRAYAICRECLATVLSHAA